MTIEYKGVPREVSSEFQISSALLRYNSEPHTPELVTKTLRAVFNYWAARATKRGVKLPDIVIPPLNVAGNLLEQPTKDIEGNFVPTITIFCPHEFEGKKGLILLGEMFPLMGSRTIKYNTPVQSENDETGWLNVEAILDAPNLDTNESQLRQHFNSLGRDGMNENAYILLSQFVRLTRGEFIDLKTLCRLLGSQIDGRVINARFGSDGDLHANTHVWSSLHGYELGGRSVKVIQKT